MVRPRRRLSVGMAGPWVVEKNMRQSFGGDPWTFSTSKSELLVAYGCVACLHSRARGDRERGINVVNFPNILSWESTQAPQPNSSHGNASLLRVVNELFGTHVLPELGNYKIFHYRHDANFPSSKLPGQPRWIDLTSAGAHSIIAETSICCFFPFGALSNLGS